MPKPTRSPRRLAVIRAQRALQARRAPRSGRAAAPVEPSSGPGPAPDHVRLKPRRPRPPVIDLVDVRKTYHMGDIAVHALRGVSLRVQRGEFVSIMGASGSGKTTLMNIIGCLDAPSHGVYRLSGRDVRGLDDDTLSDVRNLTIGFVFQTYNLIPRVRAVANVELPLSYAGVPREQRRARALEALDSVGLGHRVDHLPSELSGGQQQRVAVARALVTNPALILADEPTGNLDSASGAEVLELFERLNGEGRTIMLITHEQDIAQHARRIIRVRDGKVISDQSSMAEQQAG